MMFTSFFSPTHGNCFTFNSGIDKEENNLLKSYKSGRQFGKLKFQCWSGNQQRKNFGSNWTWLCKEFFGLCDCQQKAIHFLVVFWDFLPMSAERQWVAYWTVCTIPKCRWLPNILIISIEASSSTFLLFKTLGVKVIKLQPAQNE